MSCHLTPSQAASCTAPPALQPELEAHAGRYIPDVPFRVEDHEAVLDRLIAMAEQHHAMRRYLLTKERWDCFVSVEIGTDRMHHAFWKFSDPAHPRYAPHTLVQCTWQGDVMRATEEHPAQARRIDERLIASVGGIYDADEPWLELVPKVGPRRAGIGALAIEAGHG